MDLKNEIVEKVLCVHSIEDLQELFTGEKEYIECPYIKHEICEDPNNRWLQLIPSVSFSSFNIDTGVLKSVVITNNTGEVNYNSDKIFLKQNFLSYHIKNENILRRNSENESLAEDGTIYFYFNKEELIRVISESIKESLNFMSDEDFSNFIEVNESNVIFFQNGNSDLENVHMVTGIINIIPEEKINDVSELIKSANIVREVGEVKINLGEIFTKFDFTLNMSNVLNDLIKENNFNTWTASMLDITSRKALADNFSNIEYKDLLKILKPKLN